MSKLALIHQFNAIQDAVAEHPEGLSIDEIMDKSNLNLPRRTLQRRIAALVTQRRLITVGRGKKTAYRLRMVEDREAPHGVLKVKEREAIYYLHEPLHPKKTIPYRSDFLDDYQPNITEYLSKPIRAYLHQIGAPFPTKRPAGTYAKEISNRLLIDLSWNSSRLEGNTYSLLETERLLKFSEVAAGKNTFEAQMILNHKNAIEFLVDNANEIQFDHFTILNLHALLADNLLGNPEACGRIRNIPVTIHGTIYQPPTIPQLIEEYLQKILIKASTIQDPFEQSFFIMVQLPYLQPFIDVNKRTSRLAANIALIKNNLCPLSFIGVTERDYIDSMLSIYEFNRIDLLRDLFVSAYERSAQRYLSIQHTVSEPEPLRLRYRTQLIEIISHVVKRKMNKPLATAYIQKCAKQHIAKENSQRFIEIVETELLALHEGNIARYRLNLNEFRTWHSLF